MSSAACAQAAISVTGACEQGCVKESGGCAAIETGKPLSVTRACCSVVAFDITLLLLQSRIQNKMYSSSNHCH